MANQDEEFGDLQDVESGIRQPYHNKGGNSFAGMLKNQVGNALHHAPVPHFMSLQAYLSEKRRVFIRAVAGEFVATFIFLFVVMSTGINGGRLNSTVVEIVGGVSTAFVAVAVIYSFADVSGAHFNPAVTFGTMVMGKTSWAKGAAYIASQLCASVFACLYINMAFPGTNSRSAVDAVVVTVYDGANLGNAFATELVLSFILVYVIFAVAFDTVDTSNEVKVNLPDVVGPDGEVIEGGRQFTDKSVARNLTIYTTSGSSKAGFAPIAIGFTLGFLCFIGGSTSGGAFNPARVFGPSLVTGNFDNHWVYWLGDFCGASLAGFLQSFFAHKPKQTAGGSHS